MIIHCRNGVEVDANPYVGNNIAPMGVKELKVGENYVSQLDLPAIHTQELSIRYLTFGNLIYVVIESPKTGITRYYILEQKLGKGKIQIEDIYSTVDVNYSNDLEGFFKYNKEFERNNITNVLTIRLQQVLSYAINTDELRQQITDKLDGNNVEDVVTVEPVVTTNKENLAQIAKKAGIPYKTLWGRVVLRGVPIEEAVKEYVPRKKPSERKKRAEVVYEGKTLTELSKEYNIPYVKLWDRVHRQGKTVEQAIAMGDKKKGKAKKEEKVNE